MYLRLVHTAVPQKAAQHCKAIIFQVQITKYRQRKEISSSHQEVASLKLSSDSANLCKLMYLAHITYLAFLKPT